MTFGNFLSVIFFGYACYYLGDLSKEEESEQEVMSGRIEIEDLIPKINELAEKGKDSPLGKIVAGWNEIPQAA